VILTFCGCSVVILVYFYLLMGFLMWILMINIMIPLSIPLVIILIRLLINKRSPKVDIFECGFDSFNARVFPVSLRFFIFCIIFIVSDLELVLIFLCPFIMMLNLLLLNFLVFVMLVFIGSAVE